jgi:hypothetical protein
MTDGQRTDYIFHGLSIKSGLRGPIGGPNSLPDFLELIVEK